MEKEFLAAVDARYADGYLLGLANAALEYAADCTNDPTEYSHYVDTFFAGEIAALKHVQQLARVMLSQEKGADE